ncbi:hypothetical protein K504DRAFT_409975 [Pleomassaria siparia CBS 279.74]|uniref:Uncharacterized protein n=1 Tax=Pleomassaria siparia CBS 279.74 TaxID=1314801 RepID=A0A6G1K3Y4_9PLEO|nr:hypothetical protein K504DRAFT_409975 [Pleomassaria siparia CBS 279.74]
MEHKADHLAAHEVASNRSSDREVVQRKRGGKVSRHCKRFWWLDLIILAIVILIILIPIIFVAIPKKAQHDLNQSTLEVTSQEVTSPSPNGIHLKLVTTAKSSSKFHPTIEAFRAGLSIEGKEPFLYVNVPETKAEAETEIVVENDVTFASLDQFIDYNKVVMGSESFVVNMDGKTKLKLGGLPRMSVNYNKIITMKGLNKLNGLNITDLKILQGLTGENKTLSDGSNLIGKIIIPNPSVMLLDLGNVTMNLAIDGKAIGTTLIPNFILKPGNNTVSMQSTVNKALIFQFISTNYTDAILPTDIVGNSSIANGEHLTYYENAIKSNTIHLDLNVGPAMKAAGLIQ